MYFVKDSVSSCFNRTCIIINIVDVLRRSGESKKTAGVGLVVEFSVTIPWFLNGSMTSEYANTVQVWFLAGE